MSRALKQLRALGCRISMDDLGTGYSSLGYLQKFPFDKVKTDQSFRPPFYPLGCCGRYRGSPWWNTQAHQLRLPTRMLVSSEARMVPARRSARMRLACWAKDFWLSVSMLTS